MIAVSRKCLLGLGVCVILAFWGSTIWAAHPYHVSFAEVEWNPKTGNFEVALCVWPADLEKAISKMKGRPIDLDKEKDLAAACEAYVAGRFRVVGDDGFSGRMRWVGQQVDLKQAWLYFEIAGKAAPGNWGIENRIFFELNSDQLNQIQVKSGGLRKTFASTLEAKPFEFETKMAKSLGGNG